MQFQFIPYIGLLVASALGTLVLGIYALVKRRKAKGASSFILSMMALTIWSFANGLEMSGADFPTKLFWANIQYFAYCYSPVTLLALCMEFTGYDRWVRNRRILWIAAIPTIIIILIWTDGLHGLMRHNMQMNYSGSFSVIEKQYGPAFFIHALYSHLLNLFAWALLLKTVFLKNTIYKKQATALLIALSLIILPNIIYILGLSPVKRFDLTPVFFAPAGLIAAWGILRFNLFDVIPIAWATVIETMDAGVMVLDLQERVLDINPAFEKIVGYAHSVVSTKSVEEVCGEIPELVNACRDKNISHREFTIHSNSVSKIYEVLLSQLTDHKGMLIGRLAVTYEITEKKQAQQAIIKHQWELAVIQERERMARDLHDNLGQVLGFINLQTQGIRQELTKAGVVTALSKLDKLVEVTQSAHNEIREYIRSARSSDFVEKDFIAVLEKDIMRLEEQAGVEVLLDTSLGFTAEKLTPSVRLNIVYIVKEALNNVQKHAQASRVKVSIITQKGELCISIEDDGKGFDAKKQNKGTKTTFGLNIMKERALEIGAKVDIQSVMGRGTHITIRMPIKKEEEDTHEINAGR